MSRKLLAVVFALACALAANAEIFFWKGGGSSFVRFDDPGNWDVGSDGGGNAENRVPGEDDEIEDGTVIVLRYEGPKGGPGMREMHMVTSLLVGRGMDESCALVTDGRFSGSTRGPAIGHISPEAAAGGPIAVVEDGDMITIDIPNRRLELEVPEEVIRERMARWTPLVKERTPSLAKYAALVTSADRGAILEIPGA